MLAVAASVCWAQYGSAVMEVTGLGAGNYRFHIVKQWNDSMAVVMGNVGGNQCFMVVNHSQFMGPYVPLGLAYYPLMACLPDSLPDAGRFSVTDFSIVDDTLVFCARTQCGRGMVGWFKMAAITPSTMAFGFEYALTSMPMMMDKLLAYTGPTGATNVVAIAYPNSIYQYIIHIEHIMSFSSINYSYLEFPGMWGGLEWYYEMVQTDNYIVLAGITPSGGGRLLSMRYGDKHNFVNSVLPRVYIGMPPTEEVHASLVATHTTEDVLMVSYMHTVYPYLTHAVRSRMLKVMPSTVDNLYSQEMYIDEKHAPTAIVYQEEDGSVVLLQEYHDGVDNATKFFHLDPKLLFPSTAYYRYLSGEDYESMAAFDGHCYSAVSSKHLYQQSINAPIYAAGCPSNNSINVDTIPNLTMQEFYWTGNDNSDLLFWNSNTITMRSTIVKTHCDWPE